MKTLIECPLGGKCEKNIGEDRVVCVWYVKIVGEDAQGKEHDEWGCAMAWMPILLLENAKESRQAKAATESMRNEVIKRQDFLNKMLDNARQVKAVE